MNWKDCYQNNDWLVNICNNTSLMRITSSGSCHEKRIENVKNMNKQLSLKSYTYDTVFNEIREIAFDYSNEQVIKRARRIIREK